MTHPSPKKFPWQPWYGEEWLALRLTPELKGGWSDLRVIAWESDPPCTLPNDDEQLAMLSGLGDRWPVVGKMLRRLMVPLPDRPDLLLIPDLLKRYDEQAKKHAAAVLKGQKGGRPRKAAPEARPNQPVKLSESPALQELQRLSSLNSLPAVRTESTTEEPKLAETPALSGEPVDWRELVDPSRARQQRDREVAAANPAAPTADPAPSPAPAESGGLDDALPTPPGPEDHPDA